MKNFLIPILVFVVGNVASLVWGNAEDLDRPLPPGKVTQRPALGADFGYVIMSESRKDGRLGQGCSLFIQDKNLVYGVRGIWTKSMGSFWPSIGDTILSPDPSSLETGLLVGWATSEAYATFNALGGIGVLRGVARGRYLGSEQVESTDFWGVENGYYTQRNYQKVSYSEPCLMLESKLSVRAFDIVGVGLKVMVTAGFHYTGWGGMLLWDYLF